MTASPKRYEIQQRWEKRDRNSLWWWVNCPSIFHPKSTVRHYHARRLKLAFENALKAKGLDKQGRPIAGLIPPLHSRVTPPTGSLRLIMKEGMSEVKYADLQEKCSMVIDNMLVAQQRMGMQRGWNTPQDKRAAEAHHKSRPSSGRLGKGQKRFSGRRVCWIFEKTLKRFVTWRRWEEVKLTMEVIKEAIERLERARQLLPVCVTTLTFFTSLLTNS